MQSETSISQPYKPTPSLPPTYLHYTDSISTELTPGKSNEQIDISHLDEERNNNESQDDRTAITFFVCV